MKCVLKKAAFFKITIKIVICNTYCYKIENKTKTKKISSTGAIRGEKSLKA